MTLETMDEAGVAPFRSRHAASPPTPRWLRAGRSIAAVTVAAALVLAGGVLSANAAAPAAAKPQTVVSLTFDDGHDTQMGAEAEMNKYGMKGTFYVNSGFVGGAGFVTRANLAKLKADGQEIGGHSIDHPDLATLSNAEAKREVCNDRAVLTSWGYDVQSFAYPFASSTPANEKVVKACGYNSARMLGDIRSRFGCSQCDYAESFTPANAYYTKALDQVETTWTLADMQKAVTNAETHGGGWVQYTFHNFCVPGAAGCEEPSTTPAIFASFVKWLSTRAASNNTVVKTVRQVIGGTTQKVVTVAAPVAATSGVNGVVNASLDTLGTDGNPACWMQAGYGSNTAAFTKSAGHTGAVGQTVTVTNYVNGDAKLLPRFDGGTCAPAVTPGHTYSLRAWYKSSAATQYAVYLRTASGQWQYWTSSPWFAASPAYLQAVWTTPAIPAGMTGISFGLNLFSNGTLTTDDYALYDSVGAPAASTATVLAAPATAPAVAGPIEVHMTRTDASTTTP